MKRQEKRDKNVEEFVLRHMGLFKAPQEEMDLAEARIQERLRSTPAGTAEGPLVDFGATGSSWKRKRLALAFGAIAAAIVLGFLLQTPPEIDAHAVVADGAVSVVSGGKNQTLRAGERIEAGEILRTTDANSTITLADGSRVEMRSSSEFSLERADDGIRIHLFKGGLIINAARQLAGHLYVQTRDVIVSVVGTVFLVNAEEEGSRVAVIEGEVRVQQGEKTKNLLPGEQMSTNPKMEPLAVKEEVSWSSSAEIHMALLQQTSVVPPATSAQPPAEAKEAFEVISIRPSSSAPASVSTGARQGGPGGCLNASFQVNPGRFAGTCVTVYRLVDLAYGMRNCPVAVREGPLAVLDQRIGRSTYVRSCVSGGPDWAKSDFYDIQATIPPGSPTYTRSELQNWNAPKLQMMIQTLLADRFKLTLRREAKEVPVYNLVVEKPGKIKLSEDQTPPGDPAGARGGPVSVRGGTAGLPRGVLLNCAGNAIQISHLASCFQSEIDRPVIDKTELKGLYDIPALPPADPNPTGGPRVSTLPLALEQLGLKLEPARAPLDVLVIERVEKPLEN